MKRYVLSAVVCTTTAIVWIALAACDAGIRQAGSTSTPVMPSPPATGRATSLNVTPVEFDQALAQWQAQGSIEYQMQVDYSGFSDFMGSWTLHVQTDGRQSTVVDYQLDPGGIDSPLKYNLPARDNQARDAAIKNGLQDLTVEAMMTAIGRALSEKKALLGEWTVKFGQLGAPIYVDVRTEESGGEPFTWVVKELKIVKSDAWTPGQ